MLDHLLEETATMTNRIKLLGVTAKAETPWSALLSFATVLLASTLLLSACNTAEGIGDDMEEAGEEVGDAID
jgi:predicted small secreted protein